MVVSSALVNVSEDAEVRLVSLLSEAAPSGTMAPCFVQSCQAAIDAGQAGPLLDTVLQDRGAMAALLTLEPRGDAIAAASLLAALMEREGRSVQDLAETLLATQLPETEPRKMTLLSVLYNMRSDSTEKTALLRQMIQLAGESCPQMLEEDQPLGALLVGQPEPPLVALLDAWNVADRRELYATIARVTSDETRQKILLLLIESYPDAADAAKEAAIGAIRDPVSLFVQQRNILSLPAIQALKKVHPFLYGLLEIFHEGKLADYQAFLQGNGGTEKVIKPYGLDESECLRNMRILSLCSLASEYEEIPYKNIAETLQLPSDAEVESWVIAAMSSGLLQAKMDQLQNMVMIERCVFRKFETDQWKALQKRLNDWKKNVGAVLEGLKEAQAS